MEDTLNKAKAIAVDTINAVAKKVTGTEPLAPSAESAPTTASPTKPNPAHSIGPLSPAEEKKLDDLIAHRPSAKELQEKNILKDTHVAPALQQKQEELKKRQIEDALADKIAHRPEEKELKAHGILKEGNVAPSLQAAQDKLKTAQLKDTLDSKIAHRPSPDELTSKNILPGQGGGTHDLHQNVAHALEEKLEHRPEPETLIKEGILDKNENPTSA
ncbi:hypothetical protein BCR37DRAFT_376874 [Protomyces lactucae-debilis]|uniref:RPEL repeat protein n=1 Tax=Protomyces lactucae-debilis TaxID=2754530 RepID=A0A1Y2FQN2_PROLT|nr:uncharacterized protein BCR37DRAFT_376874 [Protomyces lactucae-debilis]ORY86303.1 hypothetical protein BCR37DRAFT_376874 [Protomyces lactucae-debilis]